MIASLLNQYYLTRPLKSNIQHGQSHGQTKTQNIIC